MKNKYLMAVFIFVSLAFNAYAKDVYDVPEIKPIINQLYPSANELTLKFAYFPIGAFNKHIGLGGSYLKLDDEGHGWEIISGYYFFEMPSGLKSAVSTRLTLIQTHFLF